MHGQTTHTSLPHSVAQLQPFTQETHLTTPIQHTWEPRFPHSVAKAAGGLLSSGSHLVTHTVAMGSNAHALPHASFDIGVFPSHSHAHSWLWGLHPSSWTPLPSVDETLASDLHTVCHAASNQDSPLPHLLTWRRCRPLGHTRHSGALTQ